MSVQVMELSEQIIVDRSPELARCTQPWGGHTGMQEIPMQPRHITDGKQGDGANCAFAMMLKEAIPTISEVHLESENPYVINNGEFTPISIGSGIVEWIGKFDRGEPVEPLSMYVSGF